MCAYIDSTPLLLCSLTYTTILFFVLLFCVSPISSLLLEVFVSVYSTMIIANECTTTLIIIYYHYHTVIIIFDVIII